MLFPSFSIFFVSTPITVEAELLDVIGTKVLRVFLFAIYKSPLLADFTPPPPLEQKWFEIGL
jgi:hypothetical protein